MTVIQQREEFVHLARRPGANMSALCKRFEISRKTGYKWLAREDFSDRSRRPHGSPDRTSSHLEAKVVALRLAHPAWGGRKIAHVLQRDQGLVLAASTVTSVLRRHGLISKQASEASQPWCRFEHDRPNSLWQMDFKGHFATETGRCHPLTVLDDHSRYNVVLQALDNERCDSVQETLQRAFEQHGLPERINTDNGPPWGSSHVGPITQLGVWLIRLGIHLSHSRPAHPQTNGKDERFHRTLKSEVLNRWQLRDIPDAQSRFSDWRHIYNFVRPHESIGMNVPASRYAASSRSMPLTLSPVEYADELVRRVQDGGWLSLRGKHFRVSSALKGQPVALRPGQRDGDFDVIFCHQRVDVISFHSAC